MDCRNCGAPMRPVPKKGFFECAYCATYHFPAETLDGVRTAGEPSDLRCPVCDVPLVQATIDDFRARHCTKCEGVLFARQAFAVFVQLRKARRQGPGVPPMRPLDPKELRRRTRCPRCRDLFETHPYFGGGNVVIDSCDRCNLLWFDRGEIERIARA